MTGGEARATGRVGARTARDVAALPVGGSAHGLSDAQAATLLEVHGPNRLAAPERPQYARIAARQLIDPLVALLLAAAIVSGLIGETLESVAIAVIVVLNAGLGFFQEAAAEKAVTALREQVPLQAAVVRDGRELTVSAEVLVPGDLLVLREGDRVAADAQLVEAGSLEADESALTGESIPVEKDVTPVVDELTPLAERRSSVFAGTSITRGRGRAVVTATGSGTELGRIASLTGSARAPRTPLQVRFGRLASVLTLAGVGLTIALTAAMLLRGAGLHESFLTGVSVAVAAVPEGLLATVTIALALGASAMAARGAVVRRLSAIETIGETSLACIDKTGTLTENRLRLAAVLPAEGHTTADVLAAAALASSAELIEEGDVLRIAGDPVEGALLLAALEQGLTRRHLVAERDLVGEFAFSPARRRMTIVYAEGEEHHAYTKGAPETVLGLASVDPSERARLATAADAWAEEGFRVLAIAERSLAGVVPVQVDHVERELLPLGLVALHDPLREDASDAVRAARRAGVEVWMLTGDHAATAQAIGDALELEREQIFSRVTPAEKLAHVERAQRNGHVVLVTGDGVNDAPALRRADVGVAMGRGGTEAAREAADIVLLDDAFATIVAAIREGRRIAGNVRKVTTFLLSANLGEVILFATAIVAGLGVPMSVVQVLTVNVLTDGLPALALARDPAEPDAMSRPFHATRRLLSPALAVAGALVGISGLVAYVVGQEAGNGSEQTMAFATIALAELVFVYTCRSEVLPAWRARSNSSLTAAVLGSVAIVALVVYAPFLQDAFGTVPLDPAELALVAVLALIPSGGAELAKRVRRGLR